MGRRLVGSLRAARTVTAVAAIAVVLAACGDGQVQRTTEGGGQSRYVQGSGVVTTIPPEDRKPAPDFTGPLLDSTRSYDLSAKRGQVVVLNVWGSWCPPCRKEAPALQRAYDALRPRGVEFVGVNTRDTTQGALAFVEEFGITYPTVVDADGSRLLAFRETLPPAAIPSTLVIDREGRMAARVLGEVTEITLKDLVATIDSGAVADGSAGAG